MKRLAIVGTAGTWKETPWDDPGVEVATLNDAYQLTFPRIDLQFELHPFSGFRFRDPADRTPITPDQLPPGTYLRPVGYLEWLAAQSQTIRVFLHDDPPAGWTRAEKFPREALCEQFREVLQVDPRWPIPYVRSGPSWMLLWAMANGYEEIGIYGIHLATQQEYQAQRAEFEGLVRYAIGKGHRILLPAGTPLLKATSVYCYEPRASQAEDGVRYQMSVLDQRRTAIAKALQTQRVRRRFRARRAQLAMLTAQREDLGQQLGRLQVAEWCRGPEWVAAMREGQSWIPRPG